MRVSSPNIFLAKSSSVPFRSPIVMPLSTTSPSNWWNSGECVASTASERYTRPGEMMRIGGFFFSIVRTCTGEVCERSRILSVM